MERIALEPLLINRRLYERQSGMTISFILHMIQRGGPLSRLLRFICLTAMTSRGISYDDKGRIKSAIRDKYGFRGALSLDIMKDLGAYPDRPTITNSFVDPVYHRIAKAVQLLSEERSLEPTDRGGFDKFEHYAPLSVRLLQLATMDAFSSDKYKEVLKDWLPGRIADEVHARVRWKPDDPKEAKVRPCALIFLGGITRAEISAIRDLGRRMGQRYMIFTTAVVTGNDVVRQFGVNWR